MCELYRCNTCTQGLIRPEIFFDCRECETQQCLCDNCEAPRRCLKCTICECGKPAGRLRGGKNYKGRSVHKYVREFLESPQRTDRFYSVCAKGKCSYTEFVYR